MTTRRRAIRLIAAVSAGSLVPRGARAQSLTPLRVGASLDDGLTPVLYGLQAGIFTRLGLDVTLQSASSGAALATAVAGGGLDVAKSSLVALISAHTRGIPFKIVAGAAMFLTAAPTTELVVPKDSPITSPTQLQGKTIIVNALRSIDEISVDLLVDQNGGTSATLKFVEIPSSAEAEALERGRGDVAEISNPALAAAIESGKFRVLGPAYEAIAKRFLIAAWFSHQDFVTRNLDAVRRFGEGVRQATLYTNGHHAETIPIIAAYSHIDPAVLRKMTPATNATAVLPAEIQPMIDAAAKYKLIDAPFAAQELLIPAK